MTQSSLVMQLNEAGGGVGGGGAPVAGGGGIAGAMAGAAASSLYPEMRFSWEIKSVDALFCNGMTRVGDLSREAILASLRECDLSVLKDEVNKNLFNDKKFCKECITVSVKYTQKLEIVEEMIDFLYAASEETRLVNLVKYTGCFITK